MMNRRFALRLLAAAPAASAARAADSIATRIIDTHTHFYDPTRPQGVPWPTKGSPLYRPVYPKDWLAVAGRHGIRETVVVEASKWLEDNDWLLNLAEKEKSVIGVVGNVSPDLPDFEAQLRRLAASKLFRGIRITGDLLSQNLGNDTFLKHLRLLSELDLALDVNGLSDPSLVAMLARKAGDLRIVINHCGNAGDPRSLRPEWKPGIVACARHPNVWCKVSALVEFNGPAYGQAPSDAAFYQPVLDPLWESFGPERLIYASNWPVSDKGCGYDDVFKLVCDYFKPKGAEHCERFFWKNSLSAYKWQER